MKKHLSRPGPKSPQSEARARKRKPVKTQDHLYLYGLHTVRAALNNPLRTKFELFVTPNALTRLEKSVERINLDFQINSPRQLDHLVGAGTVHQGVVLKAAPLSRGDLADLKNYNLVVVLDQITDPHNVGAILRSACAFGADAVISTQRHSAQETGVLAKTASGALDLVPYFEVGNLGETLKSLKKKALWCIGLDSSAETPISAEIMAGNIALVLGAEGKGLRHKTRQLCDQMVRLDMPGPIKSLNVSNAAAISLFAISSQQNKTINSRQQSE